MDTAIAKNGNRVSAPYSLPLAKNRPHETKFALCALIPVTHTIHFVRLFPT